MKERMTFEREMADLGVTFSRQIGSNSRQFALDRDKASEMLYEAGTLPVSLEELEKRKYFLKGNPDGKVSLSKVVEEYLNNLESPVRGKNCVEASLYYFTEACKKINIRTRTYINYEIPDIQTRKGGLLSWRNFLVLWFSSIKSTRWKILPKIYKAAGAPGALLYADLVKVSKEGREFKQSSSGWPVCLEPGAFLQLWRNETVYNSVKNGDRGFGHSCIFRGYIDDNTIEIADQIGLRRPYIWNYNDRSRSIWNIKYVIAANLNNVDLVPESF